MLIEFARWFVRHPPVRTVRFVWFTGEELDRRGSRAYMKMHSQDEDTICLYVNIDSGVSIEHGRPKAVVTGETKLTSAVRDLLVKIEKDISVEGREFSSVDKSKPGSGDDWAFQVHDIPTVFIGARQQKPYPHPHLPTDRFDKLDINKIQLIGDLRLTIIDEVQKALHNVLLLIQRDQR